jgi:hypothetical protein
MHYYGRPSPSLCWAGFQFSNDSRGSSWIGFFSMLYRSKIIKDYEDVGRIRTIEILLFDTLPTVVCT